MNKRCFALKCLAMGLSSVPSISLLVICVRPRGYFKTGKDHDYRTLWNRLCMQIYKMVSCFLSVVAVPVCVCVFVDTL